MCCSSSLAGATNIVGTTLSPKLSSFLAANPTAFKAMTNALSDAFSNRSFRVFYFYSDDEAEPRAFHFYPNQPSLADVVISVRENQKPLDEFISFYHETINSKSEERFAKVCQNAQFGTISRTEFARAILKIEQDAVKRTRDAIKVLELSEREKSESHYYRKFADAPDDFEESLAYGRKVSPKRDAVKEYELQYDAIRKAYKEYEMKRDASK
jgi:hypothetical protein